MNRSTSKIARASTSASPDSASSISARRFERPVSESTRRVHSELQNYFDSGTQILLDRLRTSPPEERSYRHSQVDAAVRFCAKLFGADYASTLAKAADVAAKGEQKAAKS